MVCAALFLYILNPKDAGRLYMGTRVSSRVGKIEMEQ